MSVDLHKLEQKLDKALKRESSKSMTDWLYKKRYKAYLSTTRTPVTYEVFKIVQRQLSILEEQLGDKWDFGKNKSKDNLYGVGQDDNERTVTE
jgi:hypothetical protein